MAFPFEQTCHQEGCKLKTRGMDATCIDKCNRMLCPKHRKAPYHECLTLDYGDPEEREKLFRIFYLADLDDWRCLHMTLNKSLMVTQAEALRPGHTCMIAIPDAEELRDLPDKDAWDLMRRYAPDDNGGFSIFNHHYMVDFDDGVRWMVRCRRMRKDRPDTNLLRLVMDSELETMDELRRAGIRIPQTYRPREFSQHPSRCGFTPLVPDWDLYYFIEYVDAEMVPFGSWPYGETRQELIRSGQITEKRLSNLLRSYAQQMIALSQLKVDAIGSLYPSQQRGVLSVGPTIERGVGQHIHPYFFGPFKTAKERWLTLIDYHLDLILHHDTFECDPPLCYLLFLDVRDIVEKCDWLENEESTFYVRHIDCRMNQMFWSAEGDIVAWIDWEWAIVTTKAEAFSSPMAFEGWNCNDGINEVEEELILAYDVLSRPDLAECVRTSRRYYWLNRFCNPEDTKEVPPYRELPAFRRLLLGDGKGHSLGLVEQEDWLLGLKDRYKDNEGYQQLLRQRKDSD